MVDYCVFDLEIAKTIGQTAKELGLLNERDAFSYPHKMSMSVGVVYDSKAKDYMVFDSAKVMADYLLKFNGILISYNGKRFDLPLLLSDGGCDIDVFLALQQKPHLDILADFYKNVRGKFRVGLNNIAENTLGKAKSGNGADAPLLFQQGKIKELTEYCKMDVILTQQIFEFGLFMGFIKYFDNQTGKKEEMAVDWWRWVEDEHTPLDKSA